MSARAGVMKTAGDVQQELAVGIVLAFCCRHRRSFEMQDYPLSAQSGLAQVWEIDALADEASSSWPITQLKTPVGIVFDSSISHTKMSVKCRITFLLISALQISNLKTRCLDGSNVPDDVDETREEVGDDLISTRDIASQHDTLDGRQTV